MKRNGFASILILAIVIVLAAAGYFGYKNLYTHSSATQTTIDTTNWQTYTDSNEKFEFKYPSGWSIMPESDEQLKRIQAAFESPDNGGTMLRFIFGPTTAEGFEQIFNWGIVTEIGQQLAKNKYLILTKLDEFNLSKNKVLAYTANSIQPGMEETYYDYIIKADTNYYVFDFYYGNRKGQPIDITKEKPIFDQIVSTFKFTK